MHRHRTDLVALFFGLAFLATGAGFIVHQTTGRNFDGTWIAAVGLVSIGCIFLGATLLRSRATPPVAPVTVAATPETPTETEAETGADPVDATMTTAPGGPVDEPTS